MLESHTGEDTVLKEEISKAIREELEGAAKANKLIQGYLDDIENALLTKDDYKQHGLNHTITSIRKQIIVAIFYLTRVKENMYKKGVSPEKMTEACKRIDEIIHAFISGHFQTIMLEEDLENNNRKSADKTLWLMKRNHKNREQEINGLHELANI